MINRFRVSRIAKLGCARRGVFVTFVPVGGRGVMSYRFNGMDFELHVGDIVDYPQAEND